MTLKKGLKVYKVGRHFDHFEGALIDDADTCIRWGLQTVSCDRWRALDQKHPLDTGRPLYIAAHPGVQSVFVHPAPDQDYEMVARVAEVFEI